MTDRRSFGIRTVVLCGVALVAACAPDAWKSSPGDNSFLNQIEKDCYYQRIGDNEVGDLLNGNGGNQGNYFIDLTSRLQAGQITAADWTTGVTGFLDGRSSDPGIQCVLNHLPKR